MNQRVEILQALRTIKDPELDRDIVTLNFIADVKIEEGNVTVHFRPDTAKCPLLDQLTSEIKQKVLQVEGVQEVEVVIDHPKQDEPVEAEQEFGGVQDLNHVKKVIAVMSGKGGVGKSLVTGLLAVSLRRKGYRVGILDADITGPSIPKIFFAGRPEVSYSPRAMLPPVSSTGVKVMSINLLLKNEEDAVIWRGPLVGRAIKQFWTDTLWGDIDYFIVDLPPGTSDAPLTVMQSLPISGILLVTSPQGLAGMVVRKAANMASQVGVPILGIVENMSFFKAPDTGTEYEIFGPSHADETANTLKIPVLARLPIDSNIAILCDQGKVEECQVPEFNAVTAWIERVTPDCQLPKMPA
ncbi:MAG: Mrp/NBP35 family ATP-binding protein [Anaerolineaceae bacterium]